MDYNQPANILGDEAINRYYNATKKVNSIIYHLSLDLAIDKYESLKQVCTEQFDHQLSNESNPVYTKIVEVLDYLNSLK